MIINPNLFKKTLVIGIIVLFIGLGVQPAIATEQPKEKTIKENCEDYLFQTIIDMANNPDIKNQLVQYEDNYFNFDIDKSIYRKILFKNPILFLNLIFTKPTNTFRYLNKCYKMGNEITKTIGKDKTLEIIESVEIIDTVIFDELDKIIKKDEILSNKLATIKEMNKELNPATPTLDGPIFSVILLLVLSALLIALSTLGIFNFWTNDKFILFVLIEIMLWNIYWEYFHDSM
jgi:hypothetical protein